MQPRLLLLRGCSHRCIRTFASKQQLPPLDENDLQELFVRSSGAGGQNVNKRETCVLLTHTPTGINVKVQDQRTQEQNRKIARQRMRELLDEHLNGQNSVRQQRVQKFMQKKQSKYEKSLHTLERRQRFKHDLAVFDEDISANDDVDSNVAEEVAKTQFKD